MSMPTPKSLLLPAESYSILKWTKNDRPAVCVVNNVLADFEPKLVFAWHLSIILFAVQLAEKGMPTRAETRTLARIGDDLDLKLKKEANALFLARITWDGTRQLIYRVHDPEIANASLMNIIDSKSQEREFEFEMEEDEEWQYAAPLLEKFRRQHKPS